MRRAGFLHAPLTNPAEGDGPRSLSPDVEQAVLGGDVATIEYVDAAGNSTTRTIEPAGFVGNADQWYLVAWCRVRNPDRLLSPSRRRLVASTNEQRRR